MSKKDLLCLEREKFGNEIPLLDEIYVIPTRRKHDSGYMCMEIIGTNRNDYKKKLATFSDVIDLDNIFVDTRWSLSMDIPECGVIRLFSHRGQFKINAYGISTFSFEIVEREKQ